MGFCERRLHKFYKIINFFLHISISLYYYVKDAQDIVLLLKHEAINRISFAASVVY